MLLKGTQGSCIDQTEKQYNKTIEKKSYPRKQTFMEICTGGRTVNHYGKKHCALPGKITQFLLSYFTSIPDKT